MMHMLLGFNNFGMIKKICDEGVNHRNGALQCRITMQISSQIIG